MKPTTILVVIIGILGLACSGGQSVTDNNANKKINSTIEEPVTVTKDVAEFASSNVSSGAANELVSFISAWHNNWDKPGITIPQQKEFIDQLMERFPDSYAQEDLSFSLSVDTYIAAHQLYDSVRDNLIYRLIESESRLGLNPEAMDGVCDLPKTEDIDEDVIGELLLLEMDCWLFELTELNLDLIRSFSEDSWLGSQKIRLLSDVPSSHASILEWIGNWHVRWDKSGQSVDAMRELTEELDDFITTNQNSISSMENPMNYLPHIYETLHFTMPMIKNNTILRAVGLTEDWNIEISQLPAPCEIPNMDSIPKHLEKSVLNLESECLAVELAEYLLTVQRKLAEETWLQDFVHN